MAQPCATCKHPQVREINHRIREERPYEDISRWLSELEAEGTGYGITRQALSRHARGGHAKGLGVERSAGRKPVSGSFLQTVVDKVHEAVENDALPLTVRDGISAQAELNRQADRSADRDIMVKIALALGGGSQPVLITDAEYREIEDEFLPLLNPGSDEPGAIPAAG